MGSPGLCEQCHLNFFCGVVPGYFGPALAERNDARGVGESVAGGPSTSDLLESHAPESLALAQLRGQVLCPQPGLCPAATFPS